MDEGAWRQGGEVELSLGPGKAGVRGGVGGSGDFGEGAEGDDGGGGSLAAGLVSGGGRVGRGLPNPLPIPKNTEGAAAEGRRLWYRLLHWRGIGMSQSNCISQGN